MRGKVAGCSGSFDDTTVSLKELQGAERLISATVVAICTSNRLGHMYAFCSHGLQHPLVFVMKALIKQVLPENACLRVTQVC